jgi:hypothetical protein
MARVETDRTAGRQEEPGEKLSAMYRTRNGTGQGQLGGSKGRIITVALGSVWEYMGKVARRRLLNARMKHAQGTVLEGGMRIAPSQQRAQQCLRGSCWRGVGLDVLDIWLGWAADAAK